MIFHRNDRQGNVAGIYAETLLSLLFLSFVVFSFPSVRAAHAKYFFKVGSISKYDQFLYVKIFIEPKGYCYNGNGFILIKIIYFSLITRKARQMNTEQNRHTTTSLMFF